MAYDDALQKKLDQLWFTLPAGTPDAVKGERQAMLIREFQIAARRRYGARDAAGGADIDASNLLQADLTTFPDASLPTATVPTGVADAATVRAIDAWLKPATNLRAPVVFQARLAGSHKKPWDKVQQQGFIFHDEDVATRPRVFVSDFTGQYPLDQNGVPPRVPVGSSIRWFDDKAAKLLTGIECTAKQSYQAPFDPKSITGSEWAALTEMKRATFRVLAAVASVEAEGVLDGINAYDNAVFSAPTTTRPSPTAIWARPNWAAS